MVNNLMCILEIRQSFEECRYNSYMQLYTNGGALEITFKLRPNPSLFKTQSVLISMGIKRRLESRLRFPIIDNDNNTTNVWNLRRFRSSPLFPTRHSGRFAPIFYFNCEHFLFLYIVKQKRKKSWIFKI